ncbi:hypothetical protein HZA39_01780 [Candidatus Peregrinibacteria bacterium]|nr:hypothetical protein [Candidatus Peregrinibacteria bacterium]
MEKENDSRVDSFSFVGNYGERRLDKQNRIILPPNFRQQSREFCLFKTVDSDDSKKIKIMCFPKKLIVNQPEAFLSKYGDHMVSCKIDRGHKITLKNLRKDESAKVKSVYLIGRGHFFEIIFGYEPGDLSLEEINQMLSEITSKTKKKITTAI